MNDYIFTRRYAVVSRGVKEPNMARSTNILLACAAMLAAMGLAVVLAPHN